MHEEWLASKQNSKTSGKGPSRESTDSGEWEQVGRKNKSAIILTKESEIHTSPITDIFGGQLRSSVKKHGDKASVTIQPFYCLPLDIEVFLTS